MGGGLTTFFLSYFFSVKSGFEGMLSSKVGASLLQSILLLSAWDSIVPAWDCSICTVLRVGVQGLGMALVSALGPFISNLVGQLIILFLI